MTATIEGMELKKVDTLEVQTLEVGDLIGINNDIVSITSIHSEDNDETWIVAYQNEFGESDWMACPYGWNFDYYFACEESD